MKNFRVFIGIFLLLISILIGFLNLYPENWEFADVIKDYYANVSTELIGIAITVLLIDALYEYRQNLQLKEQLIREMRSPDNGIALRAVEELRAHKWLFDGSLKGASLRKANLAGCNMKEAKLDGADFTGANLKNASFREASMELVTLSGANLEGAFLRGAKLYQAGVSGAILKNAILTSADLEGADFSGAIFNSATQWPDGFNSLNAKAIFKDD
jgi:hypothetical protein